MKKISTTFSDELKSAGLFGLPFSWGEDGTFEFSDEVTPEERTAILAVYEAHDPDNETAEQTIKRLEKVLDDHLDAVANQYRYESIRTMVTYATSEHVTFGPEGRAAVKYRDAVYAYGIEKIAACTREVDPDPIPTEAELIAGLPAFTDYITT